MGTVVFYRNPGDYFHRGEHYLVVGDAAKWMAANLYLKLRTRKGIPVVVIPPADLNFRISQMKFHDKKAEVVDW